MRLLVTGGRSGYLGREVVRAATAAGHDAVAVGSADADVRDRAAVAAVVDRVRPDAVVHTAYVQSDWDVTATGAAHVALASAGVARLVLVSSDVVFSGADVHYDEASRPDPVTAYGAAKAAAETVALAVHPDAVVARTSLIVGSDRTSQHERLVHDLAGGAPGALFDDERRCPVHVGDLAAALVELAGNEVRGVLHVAGADAMSRLDLGRLIARRDGLDAVRLRGASRSDLGIPGPIDVRLDSTLASTVLTARLRGAREFLLP